MTPLEKRIRSSALIVALGLVVEIGSFLWESPFAFFVFGGGAAVIAAGIGLFFISLITVDRGAPPTAR